jgi:hypothetical protein
MTLTTDQTEALLKGDAVRLVEPTTSLECVILRAEVYDRLKTLLYEDGPLSEAERLAAIRHAGQRAGWDDPELDVYEQYRKRT